MAHFAMAYHMKCMEYILAEFLCMQSSSAHHRDVLRQQADNDSL